MKNSYQKAVIYLLYVIYRNTRPRVPWDNDADKIVDEIRKQWR